MLNQLLREVANLKWYVVIYAVAAVLFCAVIYFETREFDWSFRRIRAFSILYSMNRNGRIAVGLLLGRFVYVICMALFGGSDGFWDLLVVLMFTIAISIASRSWKNLLQIFAYAAVFLISLTENMFISFYREVDNNTMIFVVAIFFGVFAVMYACYQTLTAYNNLIIKSAKTDKQLFDKKFYEKSTRTNSI